MCECQLASVVFVFVVSTATEICERMGSLGLQRNLVTYFTTKMHLSNPKASNMVSNFVGALYLTPFIGGFMADTYWGRFWAITVFACIQVVVSSLDLAWKCTMCSVYCNYLIEYAFVLFNDNCFLIV